MWNLLEENIVDTGPNENIQLNACLQFYFYIRETERQTDRHRRDRDREKFPQ